MSWTLGQWLQLSSLAGGRSFGLPGFSSAAMVIAGDGAGDGGRDGGRSIATDCRYAHMS
jgi:hypothetical protein